jgi:spore coat protein U-like protein
MRVRASLAGLVFTAAVLAAPKAHATQQVTTSFQVQITIQDACAITTAGTLDFGSHGVLAGNVDASSMLTVQCTATTPYSIGLSAGGGSGATVTARKMTGSGGGTVGYSLYRDAARSLVWGETVGTDTIAAVGTGATQSETVFGRVPAQSTPAPDTYLDSITVTVTY